MTTWSEIGVGGSGGLELGFWWRDLVSAAISRRFDREEEEEVLGAATAAEEK